MEKSRDSGKTSKFKVLFNKVLKKRPSIKTLKTIMLFSEPFQNFLDNAQKHFNFEWTEESLDKYITGWIAEAQRYEDEGDKLSEEEIIEKLKKWSDTELIKISMKKDNPDEKDYIEKFKEVFDWMQKQESKITTQDGKEHTGFKWYDPKKPIANEELIYPNEIKELSKELTELDYENLDNDNPQNTTDFKLKEYTKRFLIVAGNGLIEQFKIKAETFRRRFELLDTAKPYKFGDSFLPLLVYHNKNENGYRHMPRDNMWIEVGMKFGDIFICGIHLVKIYLDPTDKGFGSNPYRFYDEIIPDSYKEVGVSVFVVGIENKKTTFYYNFSLENTDIEKEKLKRRFAYACPYCSMPMKILQGRNYYCDKPSCVKIFQKNIPTVYNMDDKETKSHLRLFEMKDLWKSEDKIRLFVTNLLDFLTNKRVRIIDNYTEEELVEKNKKRAKRGKPPMKSVSIIRVDGTLKEYVSFIKRKFNGNYKLARKETPVDGHFYRFKNRGVWTGLYDWIKECKTDAEIVERLSQKVRTDKNTGLPLPDEEQYEWDSYYKHIRVWKKMFYKFKGEGEQRPRIDVIMVGDKK